MLLEYLANFVKMHFITLKYYMLSTHSAEVR